eukprot:scaffold13829_cov69-Phaeocystis_antarctica.AAC.4
MLSIPGVVAKLALGAPSSSDDPASGDPAATSSSRTMRCSSASCSGLRASRDDANMQPTSHAHTSPTLSSEYATPAAATASRDGRASAPAAGSPRRAAAHSVSRSKEEACLTSVRYIQPSSSSLTSIEGSLTMRRQTSARPSASHSVASPRAPGACPALAV